MKYLMFILSLSISLSSEAKESFPLTSKKIEIESDAAYEKVIHVLKYPEDILLHFRPEGAKITNKTVYKNEVQFDGTKTILFVSKTVRIRSVLEIENNEHICSQDMLGYLAKLDLQGSDPFIFNNIIRLEAKICLKEISNKKVSGTLSGVMFKGAHYMEPFGYIIREMIEAQVDPLLKAVINEVQSQNNQRL